MPPTHRKFTVILEAESDGGYSVYCPALPGCVSQGDDRSSAIENIKEAIELVLEVSAGEFPGTTEAKGTAQSRADTPARIADEIREVLEGRELDGLSYSGISLEQVEIAVKALS